jgi:polysaccharide export outer membrane protein
MSNHNFDQEVSQARYQGLKIKEGDALTISISAFDELAIKPFNINTMPSTNDPDKSDKDGTGSYIVSPDGYIKMPVLGRVYCLGMTKKQLKEDLEERLKTYLTDPLVDIRLTNFSISVLGEVQTPGKRQVIMKTQFISSFGFGRRYESIRR